MDFKSTLAAKIKAILGEHLVFDVLTPQEQFGDYSTNAALVAAKPLNKQPLQVAQDLTEALKHDPFISEVASKVEAVAPGFVNIHLSPKHLVKILDSVNKEPDRFGASTVGAGERVLVEYFQLNAAKPPHVGHLRSAVIGDSLKRIFTALGFKVASDTHIGDWGTQFGLLLWAYKNLNGKERVKEHPLEELNELYIEVNKLMEDRPEIRDQGKAEFVKLEQGDRENRKLWEFFISVSKREMDEMATRLGLLKFEHELGESFYEDKMQDSLDALKASGLLKKGETGEQYVDLEEYGLGRMICVKSDGGTTYSLRDLATLFYRFKELKIVYNLYVVDVRQSHHLNQVFKTWELLGHGEKSVHIDFGFMKLPEGALSTRKGNIIELEKLLGEASTRALKIIEEKNAGLKDKEKVSQMVGLGAVKYADLKHNRKSDIVFRWEDALNFEGDTGPYLQYTHARLKSILRKSNSKAEYKQTDHNLHDIEFRLLRKINHFPEIVYESSVSYTPSTIAGYLYDLAALINNFYHEVPVLGEENDVLRDFRLSLVAASATTLKNGLYLLGIEAPEEM